MSDSQGSGLSGTSLSGTSLSGTSLSGTSLSGTGLTEPGSALPDAEGRKAHAEGGSALEEGRRGSGAEAQPRAVGSPLPMGSGNSAPAAGQGDGMRALGAPPPGRGLANSGANAPLDVPSGVQRAVSAIRAALPFVQRLLPLLDGNIGAAVSNMLVPHHHAPPAPPPPPPVDLAPIEHGLNELQLQQKELRNQVVEQNSSLKRVEDQLEMVREATDRNTLEQQELLEDLKVVGNKVNLFAMIALGLLGLSVLLNIILYLHILRVLP